jgi:DNA-directed RNA polymerase subunit K/omega
MVKRPAGMNAFEFSVLSGLRAGQLSRGCTPRVLESPKLAVTAQHEIAEGKVVRSSNATDAALEPVE